MFIAFSNISHVLFLSQTDIGMQEIPGFVGKAEQLRSIGQHIRSLAPSSISILITGESGTGKERIARAIHELSGRTGPFVTIDCGALPPSLVEEELFGHERGSFTGAHERRPGMLEQAQGGTVFLDEIAELPIQLQPRLLRVIQERTLRRIGARKETPIDLRFVSATNANLLQHIEEKTFRNDLYFRIAGFTINLPSLRDRRCDIPLLVQHFLNANGSRDRSFDDAALRLLSAYKWPGNVRELENFVHRMVCLIPEQEISLDAVYQQLGQAAIDAAIDDDQPRTLAQIEHEAIQLALDSSEGSVMLAAQKLGIGKSTLYAYLKKNRAEPI
jgi:DNA-binding NtrC family response regulator